MNNVSVIRGDIKAFFETLYKPHERIHLTAITGGGKLSSCSFDRDDPELHKWVEKQNRTSNIYFTPNAVKDSFKGTKPHKEDIDSIRCLWVDLDPDKKKSRDDERTRLMEYINSIEPSPTAVIDSGNGFALFWAVDDGSDNFMEAELIGEKLARLHGGDAVHNRDRLMRVPGTINYPTRKKLEAGYDVSQARLISTAGTRYTMEQMERLVAGVQLVTIEERPIEEARELSSSARAEVWERFTRHVHKDWKLRQRWEGNTEGLSDDSRNGLDMSMMHQLKRLNFNYSEALFILRQQKKEFTKIHEKGEEYAAELWSKTSAPEPIDNATLVKYVFVNSQNKFLRLETKSLLSRESFDMSLGVEFPGSGRIPKASVVFSRDPETLKVDDIGWRPNAGDVYRDGNLQVANLYQPPTMVLKEGDIDVWLEHAEFIVPVYEHREHLLDWMAWIVQRPELKINHQVLMAGTARVGKDLFWAPFFRYWENNTTTISPRELHSDYNGFLVNAKVIQVQEIAEFSMQNRNSRRKDLENELRALFAAPPEKLMVNEKYRAPFMIDNVSQFIMFSNERHPISIRQEDGRYFCLWCDVQPKPDAYYKRYVNWMDNGGAEALMHWLMHRDVSEFNYSGKAPKTAYQEDIMEMSRPFADAYVEELTEDMEGPFAIDLVTPEDAAKHLEVKDKKTAGWMLKRAGCIKRKASYKEDGVKKHKILWAIRNGEHWSKQPDSTWLEYYNENRVDDF